MINNYHDTNSNNIADFDTTHNTNIICIYLHGFASGPNSHKAVEFKNFLNIYNIELLIPDLNQGDFTSMTLSGQLSQLGKIITQIHNKQIMLIGSSMGGLLASLLAERYPQISKIISLAPAFCMSDRWRELMLLDENTMWCTTKTKKVFHYAYNKETDLSYNFMLDLLSYDTKNFLRDIKTLIFHGIHDTVVPIILSEEYAKTHHNALLISLDDDHSLHKNLNFIMEKTIKFILE